MKKFYIGLKAVIQTEKGILLLRSPGEFWDLPGGRMEEGEDFFDGLKRELSEELPGTELLKLGDMLGVYQVPKSADDGTGLVLLHFLVEVRLPSEVVISDEHTGILYVSDASEIPSEGVNLKMREILESLLT